MPQSRGEERNEIKGDRNKIVEGLVEQVGSWAFNLDETKANGLAES